MRELSDKQAAFVREYLVDFNATQAAIRAGYSKKTAQEQGSRLLSNVMVQAELKAFRERAAEQTQTDINWVRQRLKEEATDYSEFASHSARIKAIELLARLNGDFEKDNKQKNEGAAAFLASLKTNVIGVVKSPTPEEDDDE